MKKATPITNIDSAIFNNINVGIYRNTPGPKGSFIKVNTALVKMFGCADKKQFCKIHASDLYVHPEKRKEFSDLLLKKGFLKRKELLLKRKDGSAFYAHITTVAIKDENGNVKWFDGIIEDVTETKPENAQIAAQRIRTLVSALKFSFSRSTPLKVTVSIGVSGYPSEEVKESRDLVVQADGGYVFSQTSRAQLCCNFKINL